MRSINVIKPLLSAPLSSSDVDQPRNIKNSEKFLGTPGIEPGGINKNLPHKQLKDLNLEALPSS